VADFFDVAATTQFTIGQAAAGVATKIVNAAAAAIMTCISASYSSSEKTTARHTASGERLNDQVGETRGVTD